MQLATSRVSALYSSDSSACENDATIHNRGNMKDCLALATCVYKDFTVTRNPCVCASLLALAERLGYQYLCQCQYQYYYDSSSQSYLCPTPTPNRNRTANATAPAPATRPYTCTILRSCTCAAAPPPPPPSSTIPAAASAATRRSSSVPTMICTTTPVRLIMTCATTVPLPLQPQLPLPLSRQERRLAWEHYRFATTIAVTDGHNYGGSCFWSFPDGAEPSPKLLKLSPVSAPCHEGGHRRPGRAEAATPLEELARAPSLQCSHCEAPCPPAQSR